TSASVSGSTSSILSQSVQQAATSLALTSSANPSNNGDSVTFTATLSNNSPGTIAPSGSIAFVENGLTIGSGTLDSTGVVTFTTTTLSSGQHSITAVYGGDGNFAGSSSNPVVQTVNDVIPTTIATTTAI